MTTYGEAICEGFEYLLSNYEDVVAIGQGFGALGTLGLQWLIWIKNLANKG